MNNKRTDGDLKSDFVVLTGKIKVSKLLVDIPPRSI